MTPTFLCKCSKKSSCRVIGCRSKSRRIFRVGGVAVRLCSAHEAASLQLANLSRKRSEADAPSEPRAATT